MPSLPTFFYPVPLSVFRFTPTSPSLLIYPLCFNPLFICLPNPLFPIHLRHNSLSLSRSLSLSYCASPTLTPAPLPLSIALPLVPVAELPLTRSLLCLLLPSRSGAWCGISWESECSALALQLGCRVKVSDCYCIWFHLCACVCLLSEGSTGLCIPVLASVLSVTAAQMIQRSQDQLSCKLNVQHERLAFFSLFFFGFSCMLDPAYIFYLHLNSTSAKIMLPYLVFL